MEHKSLTTCSNCRNKGHNTRTCGKGCLRLFGVNISTNQEGGAIQRSSSMGYLGSCSTTIVQPAHVDGYLSDGHARMKGKPWTEEEHLNFLSGLEMLGKGAWKGIANNFVGTRSPSQVASHAQKYFLRKQAVSENKKRRISLFDMPLTKPALPCQVSPALPLNNTNNAAEVSPAEITQTQVANPSSSHCMQGPKVSPIIPTYGGQ